MTAFARHNRWLRLCPPATRQLSAMVQAELGAVLEAAGWQPAELHAGQCDWPIDGLELRWEDARGDAVLGCSGRFDKYRAPRLYVQFERWSGNPPVQHQRAALVRSKRQFFYWWGKPWWLPKGLWSQRAAARTAAKLAALVPQGIAFAESGARGPNVGRTG